MSCGAGTALRAFAHPTPQLLSELKCLEAVQLLFDAPLPFLARRLPVCAISDPAPLLHQQLAVLPVGLEIDRRNLSSTSTGSAK